MYKFRNRKTLIFCTLKDGGSVVSMTNIICNAHINVLLMLLKKGIPKTIFFFKFTPSKSSKLKTTHSLNHLLENLCQEWKLRKARYFEKLLTNVFETTFRALHET